MDIQHDTAARRFSISLPQGEAVLEYAEPDPDTLDFLHTYVPPEAQGRGIGDALVEHALRWARERHRRVVPSCPFVRHWLREHPEYQALVA